MVVEMFDAREATVQSIHKELFSGRASCRDFVQAFLARIEAFNHLINAIVCLNPDVLKEADLLDEQLARSELTGSLFGIPILLKDNFDAIGMRTTAGSLAFRSLWPIRDASTVTALRRAGAIILGKTNLHEFALEGLTLSSLGGQTFNPYDLTHTPGGSSGGSAAAVAAYFAVMATGTDTVNSLRSPASANSLYVFKPSQGLVSRVGIVPSHRSYHNFFDPHGNSPETQPVSMTMYHIRALLHAKGAAVVDIVNADIFNADEIRSEMDVQMYEIRDQMDAYLSSGAARGEYPTSFKEIFQQGKTDFLVIPSQYRYIKTALESSTASSDYSTCKARIQRLSQSLHGIFQSHKLDAIIYPQQRNLVVPVGSDSQHGRNGILAAISGFPVIVIPAGFSEPTESAPIGIPIGLEILGTPWTEAKLLEVAGQLDEQLGARRAPVTAGMDRYVDVNNAKKIPTQLRAEQSKRTVYSDLHILLE